MDTHRWERIEVLFEEAARLPAEQRAAFLDEACAGDPALRQEIEVLLDADPVADAYLQDVSAEVVAPTLKEVLAQHDSLVGERIGPYCVVDQLGRGGMGVVYRAVRADGAFEQTVALKVVRRDLAAELAGRFLAERRILARLEHPHIARLLDGGITADGRAWLAMEHVEGEPITAWADRRQLPLRDRLALFRKVCEAVAYAHRQLVVHRDLKPSNILVTDDGTVKLLDFGVAKLLEDEPGDLLTCTSPPPMTPEYAAPEQVAGQDVTVATDVYALGVLLCELLTGRRPYYFPSKSRRDVERVILEQEPSRPSILATRPAPRTEPNRPTRTSRALAADRGTDVAGLRRQLAGDLDVIVLKTLRKEPDRRYTTAEALAEDVQRFLAGRPVTAQPDTLHYRGRKFVRRHQLGVLATSLVLLSLVGGLGAALAQAIRAEAESERARYEAAKSDLVTEFVVGLFEAADPNVTPGEYVQAYAPADVSAQAVLERGLARAQALRGQPVLQAELLTVIAETMMGVGAIEAARAPAEQAVQLRRTLTAHGVPTVDAVDLATSLRTLGLVYFRSGRVHEAADVLDEALDALGASDSPDPYRHSSVLLLRGNVLATLARDAEAEKHFLEAMALAEGAGLHNQRAEAYYQLGALYRHRGALQAAASALEAGLAAARAAQPRDPVQAAALVGYLGIIRQEQGRYSESHELLSEAHQDLLDQLPPEHPLVLRAQVHLGALFVRQRRVADALALLQPAYAWRHEHLGAGNISTAEAGVWLGGALALAGQMEAGERLMLEALDVFTRHRGPEDRYVLEIRAGIAELYRLWGRHDQAEVYSAAP